MPNNRHILEVEKRVHIHMFILFAKIRPYHKIENVKNPTTEQIPYAKHAKKLKTPPNFRKNPLVNSYPTLPFTSPRQEFLDSKNAITPLPPIKKR